MVHKSDENHDGCGGICWDGINLFSPFEIMIISYKSELKKNTKKPLWRLFSNLSSQSHLSDQTVGVPSMHLLFHSWLPICHPQPYMWPENDPLFPTLPISKQVPVPEVTCTQTIPTPKNLVDLAKRNRHVVSGVLMIWSLNLPDCWHNPDGKRQQQKHEKTGKKGFFSQAHATILGSLMNFFFFFSFYIS